MNTIKINKHNSKVLKWLQSAASKSDYRLALMGINVDENLTAVDGHRVHITQTTDIVELPKGLRDYGKIPASGIIEEPEAIDDKFPDVMQIVPREEPVFEIAVKPRFLIDALKGFLFKPDSFIVFKFYGADKPMEILGNVETEDNSTPGYALIMPVDLDIAKQEIDWKP